MHPARSLQKPVSAKAFIKLLCGIQVNQLVAFAVTIAGAFSVIALTVVQHENLVIIPVQNWEENRSLGFVSSRVLGTHSAAAKVNGTLSSDRLPLGHINKADCNGIVGWAYDPDTSGQSINVHIYDGPAFVLSVSTSQSRPDVNQAFHITGQHGYSLDLPARFKDGLPHTLKVYAINSNPVSTNPEIDASPQDIQCSSAVVVDPISVAVVSGDTITPGQSYTLSAVRGVQGFNGLVDVESIVCTTSVQCSAPAVIAPWPGVGFVDGRVVVPTTTTIPLGVYKARVRPAGQVNVVWSNQFAITVAGQVAGEPFHTPTQVMVGSLPTELATGGNIYAPEILLENGVYKMWYGGQGQDGNDRIHMATSVDGVTWNKQGVVVDNGESTHVNDPSVVKVGGIYYMYYTDAKPVIFDRIHLATSNDGQHWTKQGLVLDKGTQGWNNYIVGRPSVLYEGNQWKMWFDTISLDPQYPARYVGYATSSDGRAWNIRPQPVTTGGAVDVKKVGNTYFMLQEWQQGTLLLVSNDGVTWIDKGVFFGRSGTDFDQYGQVTPFLLLNPSTGKPQAVYFGGAAVATWNHNSIGIYRLNGTELDQYINQTPTIIQDGYVDVVNNRNIVGWSYNSSLGNAGQPVQIVIENTANTSQTYTITAQPTLSRTDAASWLRQQYGANLVVNQPLGFSTDPSNSITTPGTYRLKSVVTSAGYAIQLNDAVKTPFAIGTVAPNQLNIQVGTSTSQLTDSVSVQTGSNYVLAAKQGASAYVGQPRKLDYQLRICQTENLSQCGPVTTGPWVDYALDSNGAVTVPAGTTPGIYKAKFRPRNLTAWEWSNEVAVKVLGSMVFRGVYTPPAGASQIELFQDTNISNGLRAQWSCTSWESDQGSVEGLPGGLQIGNCLSYQAARPGYAIHTLPDLGSPNDQGKFWHLNEGYHRGPMQIAPDINLAQGEDLQIFRSEANAKVVENSPSKIDIQHFNNLGLTPNSPGYNTKLVREFTSDRQGNVSIYHNTKNEIRNVATNQGPDFATDTWPHVYLDYKFKQLVDLSQFSSVEFSAKVDAPYVRELSGWTNPYKGSAFQMVVFLRKKSSPFVGLWLVNTLYSGNQSDYQASLSGDQWGIAMYRADVNSFGGPLVPGTAPRTFRLNVFDSVRKAALLNPALGQPGDYYLDSVEIGNESLGYQEYKVNLSNLSMKGVLGSATAIKTGYLDNATSAGIAGWAYDSTAGSSGQPVTVVVEQVSDSQLVFTKIIQPTVVRADAADWLRQQYGSNTGVTQPLGFFVDPKTFITTPGIYKIKSVITSGGHTIEMSQAAQLPFTIAGTGSEAVYNGNDPRVIFTGGGWTNYTSLTGAYGDDEVYTAVSGATAKLLAPGNTITGFQVYGAKAFNRGTTEVLIDGASKATFDAYSATTQVGVLLFDSGPLVSGAHDITLINRSTDPSRPFIGIDKIVVKKQ